MSTAKVESKALVPLMYIEESSSVGAGVGVGVGVSSVSSGTSSSGSGSSRSGVSRGGSGGIMPSSASCSRRLRAFVPAPVCPYSQEI